MSRLPLLLLVLSSLSPTAAEEVVPAYLLELPQSVATVLIAESETSTLYLYERRDAGPQRIGDSYMSVGQNGVGKERAWDKRTPLGIYFVSEQLDTTNLDEKYGPTAFPLDYPNTWDRLNRRSGDGIWIHGVTPQGGRRPPLDTDGCIALPNDELLALGERLQPLVTPVLITRRIERASAAEVAAARDELRQALQSWAQSFAAGDLHRYLSLYAEDFGYRGMNRDEWIAFRTQSITRAPPRDVQLSDVLLLADPEEEGLYLSRFRQAIVYADRTVVTTKRLYWHRMAAGELRIVAEDNG